MAEFAFAIKKILEHEGGYANVSGDLGGETYRGITRKNFSSWEGWKILEKYRPLKHNQIVEDTELESAVKVLYKRYFWNVIKGDSIQSQNIATFLFDWFVNSGTVAIKALQRIVGVPADGVLGPKTLAGIESLRDKYVEGEEAVYFWLKAERISFVTQLSRKPGQKKFLKGWLNRINSFQ